MSDISVAVLNQYLTFTLGKEKYGINIVNTREVLEATELTRVPRMPEFMCGVINLRGSVVPVLDLKSKFKMDDGIGSIRNNIIVTEVDDLDGGDGKLTIGIYTDSVQKVLTIEPEDIEAAPKIGIPINTEFIHGMGKVDEEFIILLNINKILNTKDLHIIRTKTEVPSGE
ncbi:chemotaxis protein CheW [Thiospirochaeta perfilievii]|uniref:Chemotaxis protein CheW n=1 Tax=Thiospirochaeta perfilievii TaxID=252967 RepID=A0A5C1QB18_9SPIO|nr:chemotaxis protein CheW [Thiospirochaeta perfilievii]QEN03996.1 chemotaxis protein CheW [Thiospirochaeta perfilievii]